MDLNRAVLILSVTLFLGCHVVNVVSHGVHDDSVDCPTGDPFEEDHESDNDVGHSEDQGTYEDNGDGDHGDHEDNGNSDHGDHEDNGNSDHGDHEDNGNGDHGDYEDHSDCEATSYKFDGVWYYESMSRSPELKDFTLSAYVTADSNGAVSGPIFNIYSSEQDSFTVYGGIQNSTKYLKIILEGQQRKVMTSFSPNTKYHIAIVVNAMNNSVSVFIDGKFFKKVSFSSITSLSPNGRITIGNAIGGSYKPYKGTIQDLMLWDSMLTNSEITELHGHSHCLHDPVLVLHEHDMVPQKYGVPIVECSGTEHMFNNTGDRVEYFEINGTLPQLEFATICAKITTDASGIIPGTTGSYGTKDEPEGISITGYRNSKGEAKNAFVIHGQIFVLPGQFQPNTKYSMCIIYYFKHNHLMTFVNNQPVTVIQFDGINYLPGGGKLILGQRQQKLGGCFDYPYTGPVTDFMLWGRVISQEELRGYSEGKCPNDVIVSAGK